MFVTKQENSKKQNDVQKLIAQLHPDYDSDWYESTRYAPVRTVSELAGHSTPAEKLAAQINDPMYEAYSQGKNKILEALIYKVQNDQYRMTEKSGAVFWFIKQTQNEHELIDKIPNGRLMDCIPHKRAFDDVDMINFATTERLAKLLERIQQEDASAIIDGTGYDAGGLADKIVRFAVHKSTLREMRGRVRYNILHQALKKLYNINDDQEYIKNRISEAVFDLATDNEPVVFSFTKRAIEEDFYDVGAIYNKLQQEVAAYKKENRSPANSVSTLMDIIEENIDDPALCAVQI